MKIGTKFLLLPQLFTILCLLSLSLQQATTGSAAPFDVNATATLPILNITGVNATANFTNGNLSLPATNVSIPVVSNYTILNNMTLMIGNANASYYDVMIKDYLRMQVLRVFRNLSADVSLFDPICIYLTSDTNVTQLRVCNFMNATNLFIRGDQLLDTYTSDAETLLGRSIPLPLINNVTNSNLTNLNDTLTQDIPSIPGPISGLLNNTVATANYTLQQQLTDQLEVLSFLYNMLQIDQFNQALNSSSLNDTLANATGTLNSSQDSDALEQYYSPLTWISRCQIFSWTQFLLNNTNQTVSNVTQSVNTTTSSNGMRRFLQLAPPLTTSLPPVVSSTAGAATGAATTTAAGATQQQSYTGILGSILSALAGNISSGLKEAANTTLYDLYNDSQSLIGDILQAVESELCNASIALNNATSNLNSSNVAANQTLCNIKQARQDLIQNINNESNSLIDMITTNGSDIFSALQYLGLFNSTASNLANSLFGNQANETLLGSNNQSLSWFAMPADLNNTDLLGQLVLKACNVFDNSQLEFHCSNLEFQTAAVDLKIFIPANEIFANVTDMGEYNEMIAFLQEGLQNYVAPQNVTAL